MKLDHELNKKILAAIEELSEPYVSLGDVTEKAGIPFDEKAVHHFEILADQDLVARSDGSKSMGVKVGGDGHISASKGISIRLTAEGHEYILAINKSVIWEKAKSKFGDLGMAAMKEGAKVLIQGLVAQRLQNP